MAIAVLLPTASSANAVTYGSEVTSASESAPWVASIWYAPSPADYYDPQFICSGTLIEQDVVLTAAHCVLSKGFYFVKLGADRLSDDVPLREISAVWKSPKYSAKSLVNDFGLLALTESADDIEPLQISKKSQLNTLEKIERFKLYGWGDDQNGETADLLRSSSLSRQTKAATDYFGRTLFNPTIMMAAGAYRKSDKTYSGACNGDSGGPLTVTIASKQLVVGVTSAGATGCNKKAPTIFTKVPYFEPEIKKGIGVVRNAVTGNNRAAPGITVEPSIVGDPRVGSYLTCDKGEWTSNTDSVTTRWTKPVMLDPYSPSVYVSEDQGGTTFECEVVGSNKNASLSRTVSVFVPKKPSSSSYIFITGIDQIASVRPGTIVGCNNLYWQPSGVRETFTWYVSSSNSFSRSNQIVGTSQNLLIDAQLAATLPGKYLQCVVTGTNDGGSTSYYASTLVPMPWKPTVYTVTVSGFYRFQKPLLGTVATCDYTTSYGAPIDTLSIRWGFSTYAFDTNISEQIGSGKTLTIDQTVMNKAGGKYLLCSVTAGNASGSSTAVGSLFLMNN